MQDIPADWATHPEKLPIVHGPYDILEPRPGQVLTLLVDHAELGQMTIVPRGQTAGKIIPVLRLFLEAGSKPALPPYWDLTSKHLIADLIGRVFTNPRGHALQITRTGSSVNARHTVLATPR